MYDIDLSSGSDSDFSDGGHRLHGHAQHKQIDKAFKKIFTKPTTKGRGDASNSNITAIKGDHPDNDFSGGLRMKARTGSTAYERRAFEEKEARIRKEALAHAGVIDSQEKLEGLSRGLNRGIDISDPFLQAVATNTEHDFLSEEHRYEFEQLLADQGERQAQRSPPQRLGYSGGRVGRVGRVGGRGRGLGRGGRTVRIGGAGRTYGPPRKFNTPRK